MIQTSRRGLITGLASLIVAAPAIVHASSLAGLVGDVYELWTYRQPLFPPIDWRADPREPISFDGYIGPNGHLYVGEWTLWGKKGHHSIWTDEAVHFEKYEFVPVKQADDALVVAA